MVEPKRLCWKRFGTNTPQATASKHGCSVIHSPYRGELSTGRVLRTLAGHEGPQHIPRALAVAARPVAQLMSAREQFLTAVKEARDRTGDPNAWQAVLSPSELAAVITPTARPEQLLAIADKIRQQHSALPDREKGAAAEAIARAEAALAQQNSASSQLDMQVIAAIMNAHLNTMQGSQALTNLQQDTEAAVRTRSDLDTPAGARDFQRFLIGKLRDIRTVVLNASLDDTSKSALMAAWTSLYDASKDQPKSSGEHPSAQADGTDSATAPSSEDSGWDPLLDSLLADDSGPATGELSGAGLPQGAPASAAPMAPVLPPMPSFSPGLPSFGTMPTGLPLTGLQAGDKVDPALQGLDDEGLPDSADRAEPKTDASSEQAGDHNNGDTDHGSAVDGGSPPAGPTTVTLPDGETVTAASPQLAAAIQAAVGGVAIPDAFRQQGITIPPPGSAVNNPIEPSDLTPADIGMFIDRHALALGPGKALLDGEIQDIGTVSGPTFLGWEHPPTASAAVSTPAKPDTPTPTRPASSSTT